MDYIIKQPIEKNIPIETNIEKSALSWTLTFDEGMPVINKPDYTQKEEDKFNVFRWSGKQDNLQRKERYYMVKLWKKEI
jgi:hypothetical protein